MPVGQGTPGTLLVTVDQVLLTEVRAFAWADGVAREVPVATDSEEIVAALGVQFEANPCLAWHTWITAIDRFQRQQQWSEADELMRVASSQLPLWDRVGEIVESRKRSVDPKGRESDGLAFLERMLEDASSAVRRDAALALCHLGELAVLQTALNHRTASVRMLAAGALRRCGSDAMPAFREGLRNRHWFVRWQAVVHMRLFGEVGDVAALRSALDDEDPDVRSAAVRALGRRRERSAEAALRALQASDWRDSNGRPLSGCVRDALLNLAVEPPGK